MAETWDANFKAAPTGGNAPSVLDDKIRQTRAAVEERASNEHTTVTTGTSGGVSEDWLHKKGSARAYYQAGAPTLRPDGTTALDASDDGRPWIDSDDASFLVWNGSAFVNVKSAYNVVDFGAVTASATSLLTSIIIGTTVSTTYTLGKASSTSIPIRIYTFITGTARFVFTMATSNALGTATARIYKNGVAVGTEQTTSSTSGESFSEDLACALGDYFDLYIKTSNASYTTTASGFELRGTLAETGVASLAKAMMASMAVATPA